MLYIGTGGFPYEITNITNKQNVLFNRFQLGAEVTPLKSIENTWFIGYIGYLIRKTISPMLKT